jgi:hypothetical protein
MYDLALGTNAFWMLTDESRLDLVMGMLVQMWQTMARGIRGNVPVIVGCLDAKFAPESAQDNLQPASYRTSLLAAFRWALRGYMEGTKGRPYEQTIMQSLYGPFYHALSRMEGIRFEDEPEGPDLPAGL